MKNDRYKIYKAFTLSLLLHLCIIGYLFIGIVVTNPNPNNGIGNDTKGSSNVDQVIIPKNIEVDIIPGLQKDECNNLWYGGIGINLDYFNCITEVAFGYPAQKAGIKVGDCIVDIPGTEILGVPGTSVTIEILRGKNTKILTLIREKICVVKQ